MHKDLNKLMPKSVTVAELIEQLKAMPQEATVCIVVVTDDTGRSPMRPQFRNGEVEI